MAPHARPKGLAPNLGTAAGAVLSERPRSTDVLIVDDEENARSLLRRKLTRAGVAAEAVGGASEALAWIADHPPKLVLLDLRMPDLDGAEVLARLRKDKSPGALPVIVVTASDDRADLWRCLDAGANDYVTKPIDEAALLKRVRVQLQVADAFRALEASERRLARASASGPEIGWSLDAGSDRIDATDSFLRIFRCPNGECALADWLDGVLADDRAALAEAIESLRSGQRTAFERRVRVVRGDEEVSWTLVRGHVERDALRGSISIRGDVLDLSVDRSIDRVCGVGGARACRLRLRELRAFGDPAPVAIIDIDDFNALLGPDGVLAADDVLRGYAGHLVQAARETAEVFRLCADQFVMIGARWLAEGAFHDLAARIAEGEGCRARIGDRVVRCITSCVGVVPAAQSVDAPERVLLRARLALKAAKAAGQGRVTVWSEELERQAVRGPLLADRLRLAIAMRAIAAEFQPIVELASGRWVAVEARLQWRDELFGDVAPAELAACAEATGASLALTELLVDQAFALIPSGRRDDLLPMISLKLPPGVIGNRELGDLIQSYAETFRIDPRRLVVGVSEEELPVALDPDASGVEGLIKQGAQLALDDYGSSCPSLTHLFHAAPTWLKLDGALLLAAEKSEEGRALLASLSRVARHLGKTVVMSKIDSASQAAIALELGAMLGQGGLYSGPLDASAMNQRWMTSARRSIA